MNAGEEYIQRLWDRDGSKLCGYCQERIIYDLDSGYWIHAGFDKIDGHNGLYCSPAMWVNPELRKYAYPGDRSDGEDRYLGPRP